MSCAMIGEQRVRFYGAAIKLTKRRVKSSREDYGRGLGDRIKVRVRLRQGVYNRHRQMLELLLGSFR